MSTGLRLRFRGPFSALSKADQGAIVNRSSVAGTGTRVASAVSEIIADVRERGDEALRTMAKKFDGVDLEFIEVPKTECSRALANLPESLRRAMERSAGNIRAFHESQKPVVSSITIEPGIEIGRRPDPFERVGVYAPGGRAAYPSSVLMGAIPARVAGVEEVILCSPPADTGLPADSILAAAALSGVDRVFAVGGAGAIAAMCLGTETIPRVNKVVGPGNTYVAEAKLQLATAAAFDSPAGPSELLLIADESCNPATVARETLAQAEHDPEAIVIVVAVGGDIAGKIENAIESTVTSADRAEIINQSLSAKGGVVSVDSIDDAIALANAFAPEHLLIATRDPQGVLKRIRNAGTVFLGESSSVSFGDYMTGANHVLPTGGLARSYSGLSTLDFIRWTTFQTITPAAAASMAQDVDTFAKAERLYAHGAAAAAWMNTQ